MLLPRFLAVVLTTAAVAGASLAGLTSAPAAAAAVGQVANPCQKLSAGQVKFNNYGAPRVTFATATDRGHDQLLITGCAKRGNGYVQEWQTTGYGGIRGFAAPGAEWESTFKSPTGSFTFTEALGRSNPGTALKYHTVNVNSRWGGDRGATYNQYFEGRGGESDENLYTQMNAGYYEQAAVINYNRLPDATTVQGASFAIFFHAGNVASAGCVSTNLATVTRVLRTNRPGDRIVMGAVGDVFRPEARKSAADTAGKSVAAIRSSSDEIAVGPDGTLWNYPALGNGSLGMRVALGSGWRGVRSGTKVDWNRDGYFDLLAQWNNGTLTVYPGRAAGGFGSPFTVGWGGWNAMTVVAGTWDKTRRYPGILARDAAGKMWLYDNPGGRDVGSRRLVGTGWSKLSNMTMTDWDGNGIPDLVATTPGGQLYLYRQDGRGTFRNERRPMIGGAGWNAVRSISAGLDYQGGGTRGLNVVFKDGVTRYYALGAGRWGNISVIGRGWQVFALIGR